MTPEQRIVSELAQATGQRIARQVRVAMQRMTDCRLSGDDSPLNNTWEELCVQVQSERFVDWFAYEATVEGIVQGCVEALPLHEAEALWLQKQDAPGGCIADAAPTERPVVCYEDVTHFVIANYVHPLADEWTNARIRAYLDRATRTD